MITLQEVVDRNWQFFIRERGLPGVMSDGCVYRAPNGGRCAIGCVLPENIEVINWEVPWLLESNEEVADFFQGVSFDALEELADLHDTVAHRTDFHARYRSLLRDLAAKWGLTIPDSYLLDDPKQLLLFQDAVSITQCPLTFIDMKSTRPAPPCSRSAPLLHRP